MLSPHTKIQERATETGSALVYILIAIALLAALTFSFMEPSSQQSSAQNTFKTVSAAQGQVDIIRSAIQECVLLYPNGDSTIAQAGYNKPYPLNPDSTHLPVAGSYRAADKKVANIRCPGDNDGSADQHKKIFSGAGGKFMPPPPDLFMDWQYYNGTDGVFYWIETDKSDAYVKAALQKMDDNFGECEADFIDASGGAIDLDSDTTISCPLGRLCFRVWMIIKPSASAVHQDAGCP
ncbi:MAG: hypothetical protein IT559_07430 [Alphaproteobacteria bacterium]|nr:hypothetical protein [Alphaproteobacteria bacterium]